MKPSPTVPHPALPWVLAALARQREPGFHFVGDYLDLAFDEVGAPRSTVSAPVGVHNRQASGDADLVTLAVLSDIAIGTSMRAAIGRPVRMATVSLHLQLMRAPHGERLSAQAVFDGMLEGVGGQQGAASATLLNAQGQAVCLARGTFMAVDLPTGSMPAIRYTRGALPPSIAPAELHDDERSIYRRAQAAGRASGDFGDHFWGFRARRTAAGSSGRLAASPQVANRMGHVQGGVLMALAERTACAALAGDWLPTSLYASFLRPGMAPTVRASARLTHQGRNTAMVRVQLSNADGKPCLEALLTYAPRVQPAPR